MIALDLPLSTVEEFARENDHYDTKCLVLHLWINATSMANSKRLWLIWGGILAMGITIAVYGKGYRADLYAVATVVAALVLERHARDARRLTAVKAILSFVEEDQQSWLWRDPLGLEQIWQSWPAGFVGPDGNSDGDDYRHFRLYAALHMLREGYMSQICESGDRGFLPVHTRLTLMASNCHANTTASHNPNSAGV